jgi:succinyl-CoA synthetase alpha subunit|tara:strand:- start:246 stop:443 length:198 start_codon:yes stop_codon:yes gene_type:complete
MGITLIRNGKKMNTYRINAIMENDDEKSPIVFTFELPGEDEESVYTIVENMNSVKKIISVENIKL